MEETEAQVISFDRICRFCLQEKRVLRDIFEPVADNSNLTIDQKIMACASVDLLRNDGLPSQICTKCLASVNAAFEFRIQCENADKTLHDIHNLFLSSDIIKKNEEIIDINSLKDKGREKISIYKDKSLEDFDQIIVIKKPESEPISTEEEDLFYIVNEDKTEEESKSKVFEGNVVYYDHCSEEGINPVSENEEKLDSEEVPSDVQKNFEEAYKMVINSPEDREGIGVDPSKEKDQKKMSYSFEEVKKSPCPFCNKMLVRVDEHIRLLHRNRVYICTKPNCRAEFLTLKNLQSHQLRCFDIKKGYKCWRCGKEFHRKSNLKAHAKRHGDKKDFQCQLCDRAFVDSTGLRRHFLKHHEPEQEVFVSGCCGKKFKSKEGLTKHIQKSICGVQILQVMDSNKQESKSEVITMW